MKELTYFEEIEEKGKKYTVLSVSAYDLTTREHREIISELEEEGVRITAIDRDSVFGEVKGSYDVVRKTLTNLEAKKWFWNE